MDMTERRFLFLDQMAFEQMAGVCRSYESVDGKLNIQGVLAGLSYEGVNILIAKRFFEIRGYAAHVVEQYSFKLLVVSKNKVPGELALRQRDIRKRYFAFLQQENQPDAEKKVFEKEKAEIEREIECLPAFFHPWTTPSLE